MKKYGSYEKYNSNWYIYRTEYIPSIHCCLELFVKKKPKNCKLYQPKKELTQIEKLKQKIRKLTDKLADAQMELDRENNIVEYYQEIIDEQKLIIKNTKKYVKKELKKNCGKVLSEKTYNGLLEKFEGSDKE